VALLKYRKEDKIRSGITNIGSSIYTQTWSLLSWVTIRLFLVVCNKPLRQLCLVAAILELTSSAFELKRVLVHCEVFIESRRHLAKQKLYQDMSRTELVVWGCGMYGVEQ